jgi:hypothetical protein
MNGPTGPAGPAGATGATGATGAANSTTVTISTAATGSTLNGTAQVDETIYLKSSTTSPVASIGLVLPSAANSRIGQVKTFISSKDITSTSISASGGTIDGTPVTTAVAYEPYSFQYVSTSVWLRLA